MVLVRLQTSYSSSGLGPVATTFIQKQQKICFQRGEGGRRAGSAPGAGRSRAARVGSRVVAGMGGGPSCAPGIPTAAGKAPGAWQGRGGAGRGALLAGVGEGFPVVLSGVAVAAWNAHCVRSCVPKGRHPVGAAEGCGPQVRELGLRGAGNHVVRPLLAQPGGRRKASPLGSRP